MPIKVFDKELSVEEAGELVKSLTTQIAELKYQELPFWDKIHRERRTGQIRISTHLLTSQEKFPEEYLAVFQKIFIHTAGIESSCKEYGDELVISGVSPLFDKETDEYICSPEGYTKYEVICRKNKDGSVDIEFQKANIVI